MAKYDVDVQLSGTDGNAFSIMGTVSKALRKAGASRDELELYMMESTAGDYDNLLRVAMQWVNVK